MPGSDEIDLLRLLQQFWGYKTFRPLQQQAIQGVLAGRDVLLILPTGGGKSLTFQIPPLTREYAVTGVVCPLIALAKVNLSHQIATCLISVNLMHSAVPLQSATFKVYIDKNRWIPLQHVFIRRTTHS